MRHLLSAAAALCSHVAIAQTSPGFTDNTVLFAAPLNAAIAGKADSARLDAETARPLAVEAGKMDASGSYTARMGTAARTGPNRAVDRIGPADFLAAGQTKAGLTSAAFNASPSINAALATGSAVLPCGTYLISTPLTLPTGPTRLQGTYPGCVTVNVGFPTGDAILVKATSRSEIDDILFVGTVARTSGAIIHIQGGYGTVIRNVGFDGSRFRDVLVDGANTTRIMDSDFRPGATSGCITLTGTAIQAVDTFVSRTNLAGCRFGIYINHASGVYLNDMDIVSSTTNAVLIVPDAAQNQNVDAVRANNVLADTTKNGHGWQISGDGTVSEIHLSNSWGSGSGNQPDGSFNAAYAGLYANNPNLSGMILTSFYAHHNGGQGINIESGQFIKLVSPMTCMNGVFADNTYDGIVVGANTNFVTVSDPTSGECGYMRNAGGFRNKQRWGLFINNTNSTLLTGQFVSLIGGQYSANLTGTWAANLLDPNLTIAGQATGCPALSGTGAPIMVAPACSTYSRTDGSAGSSFYVKESATGSLGWVPK